MNRTGMQLGTKCYGSVVAALIFGTVWGAYAQDTAWKTAVNGSWTNSANWNNGIPNANAALLTNTTASYTVTFDGGAGNSITNLVIQNASVGNVSTLNVNSGLLNVTGPQGTAGGVMMLSNAVLNLAGGNLNDSTLFSLSGGSVVAISNTAPVTFLSYDNFESYSNHEVLATSFTTSVTGSPWGRFGAAVSDNPVAVTGIGVGGSMGAQFPVDWSQPSGNNANLVFWFPSTTNLVATPGINIALEVSNVTGVVSNTIVKVAFEEPDGTVWQTTTGAAQVLTNAAYQTFTFTLQQSDMESVGSGSSPFDLSQVTDLRIRFENAGTVGSELLVLDNFQAFTIGLSTWNQTAGVFNLGEVGNGTVIIGPGGLMTGQANSPSIGRNDTYFIPATAAASNAVGHLYLEGGTFVWPGRNGSANPFVVGRGQIGIVTVSNGWFELTSVQATNGLRVGYTSGSGPSIGRGTVEMFGGVVTNTGFLQVGAGQGTSATFGVGTLTVSGGTFYQLGAGVTGTTASVRLPNASYDTGYLTVNGTGTCISTNAIIVGNDAQASGSIQVAGSGQLIVTNIAANPGLILLGVGGTGTLSLSGGLTVVDRLVATGGVHSIVNFAGGELDVNVQTVVTNGLAFTVGDGTHAATLDFVGGTHWFGNGLGISNNATLTGAAVINGNVAIASGGAISPGGNGVVNTLALNNNLVLANGGVLQYDLGLISDLITVGGNLTLGGTLNIADSGGFGVGTYTLFTYSGTLTTNGSPSILTIGTTPNGALGYTIDISTAGVVKLNVSTAPSDPFAIWQSNYFPGDGPNAAPNADPFGKGISNTNQFLAGFNPTNTAAYLHVINIAKVNGTDIQVTYLGANGDSTYTGGPASRTNVLEFTTGTANASYTNNFVSTGQTNILSSGTGLGVVTNMVDSGGATNKPARYYRVRVLVP